MQRAGQRVLLGRTSPDNESKEVNHAKDHAAATQAMAPSRVEDTAPATAKESVASLNLRLLTLAGEELTLLSNARTNWTYQDVANALMAKLPLTGAGQVYKFVSADKILKPGVPLSEYGLGSDNGHAEITACVTTNDFLIELEATGKPKLEAAYQNMRSIRNFKACIHEIRALKNPPRLCLLTVEAVYSLLGRKKVAKDWEEAKSVLADATVLLQQFQNFDYMQNPGEIVQRLTKYVENPEFDPEQVKRASLGCEKMCAWCHALYACAKLAQEAEALWS